jgi:hypothetical protein
MLAERSAQLKAFTLSAGCVPIFRQFEGKVIFCLSALEFALNGKPVVLIINLK